jgi:hypothetical protein
MQRHPSTPADSLQSDVYPGGVPEGYEANPWLRRGAAIAAAFVVAGIAYFLITNGDDDGSKDVVAADADEIRTLSSEQSGPVYWAGPAGAETFEWTKLSDGRIYIRYLTGGAEVEDPRPRFLTVGTYAVGNGVAAINKAAKSPGTRTLRVEGGGTALVNRNSPTSVYLAYPDSKYQIEVFDPNPTRALRLVTSGRIQPVR